MCCEQLVCAHCAGPVSEGRCATCRAARERLHHSDNDRSAYLLPVVLALLVVAYLAAVVYARTT